ncbi:hypothetical protein WISP_29716 [Willisornis vidua]|uniref:RNA-directed DNA polymerase n=1 Tax=Willisornis vidua TaxID=1566151 RepID=A0ABQ9DQT5_9PASS|nr:hypothetical protein WISP_29716 [Willisornis vidua]
MVGPRECWALELHPVGIWALVLGPDPFKSSLMIWVRTLSVPSANSDVRVNKTKSWVLHFGHNHPLQLQAGAEGLEVPSDKGPGGDVTAAGPDPGLPRWAGGTWAGSGIVWQQHQGRDCPSALSTGTQKAIELGLVVIPALDRLINANVVSVFIEPTFVPVELCEEDIVAQLLPKSVPPPRDEHAQAAWSQLALNIVSDAAYVVGVVSRIENSYLKEVSNQGVFQMFSKLLSAVQHRECPFYIQHVRSHTMLPGPIVEGNRVADRMTNSDLMINLAPVPNRFEQAQISHKFFHQSAESLRKNFDLSVTQARAIVSTCPDCQKVTPVPQEGVYPRGLHPLDLWQTDVTHVQQFGRLRFVHVSVDTCSGLLVATAHVGEKAKDVKHHFSSAFSIMGVPKQMKTDNGPAYVSSTAVRGTRLRNAQGHPRTHLMTRSKKKYQGDRLEELEILGTLRSPMCLYFKPKQLDKTIVYFNVTCQGAYSNFRFWCKEEVPFSIPPMPTPATLPKGLFLLFGKRAWKAIPSMAVGGPCTIGRLTLYNPAKFINDDNLQLKETIDASGLPTHVHQRSLRCRRTVVMRGWGRSIKRHVGFGGGKRPVMTREEEIAPEEGFTPPRVGVTPELPPPQIWGDHHPLQKIGYLNEFVECCDSTMEFWSPGKNLAGSLFIPAIGTKHALDLLTKMGCWLAKEANATSQALEELLEDTQNNKRALLQNPAAIDFLLLVNGHGCQEFEGLCCMNFSDHSLSIHSHISQLKSMVHQLKEKKGFSFDDLFSWLPFKGWSETVKKGVVVSLIVLIIVVMFMCVLPCIFQCSRTCRAVSSPQAFPVQQQQNKKRADVRGDEEFIKWQRYYKRWVDEDTEVQESGEPMRQLNRDNGDFRSYMDMSPV